MITSKVKVKYNNYQDKILTELERSKERALTKVGLYVRDNTKLLTPVITGNLRNSYDYDVSIKNDFVNIGTNVLYGRSVEKRKPHLSRAIKNNLAGIKQIIKDELK